jgi:DNA-binding transcriptional LysR family regulator
MAVAENLHFGKAAEKLFIAQPPLSRQIKQLENELGVVLFNRDKRNVSLTPQGEYLYDEVQKIFGQIESIKKSLCLIDKGIVGQINIGYIGAAMHSILPIILAKLKTTYKDIHTVLIDMNNIDQIQALKNGEIDIGFIRMPVNVEGFKVKTIYREKFALVLPFDYKCVGSDKQMLKSLSEEPFIYFSKTCGPALLNSIISICNKCGFSPNVVHRTYQINSIIRLVESGCGYSIVPASVKHGYDLKVKFIDLNSFDEKSELSVIYSDTNLKPIVRNFLEIIFNMKNLNPDLLSTHFS